MSFDQHAFLKEHIPSTRGSSANVKLLQDQFGDLLVAFWGTRLGASLTRTFALQRTSLLESVMPFASDMTKFLSIRFARSANRKSQPPALALWSCNRRSVTSL